MMNKDMLNKDKLEKMEKEIQELTATVSYIGGIINEAERMRNCYFWEPRHSARDREKYDDWHSWAEIEWEDGGKKYSAEFCTTSHCSYIVARGYYYRDDRKTTLTAIRNSHKRLEAKLEELIKAKEAEERKGLAEAA